MDSVDPKMGIWEGASEFPHFALCSQHNAFWEHKYFSSGASINSTPEKKNARILKKKKKIQHVHVQREAAPPTSIKLDWMQLIKKILVLLGQLGARAPFNEGGGGGGGGGEEGYYLWLPSSLSS